MTARITLALDILEMAKQNCLLAQSVIYDASLGDREVWGVYVCAWMCD